MATPSVAWHSGDYTTAEYTAGSDVTGGAVIVQGDLVCVAVVDIDSDSVVTPDKGALAVDGGIWKFPKGVTTSDAITAGALCYWDSDNSVATTTAGSWKKIGLAVEAAAAAATTVKILLGSRA